MKTVKPYQPTMAQVQSALNHTELHTALWTITPDVANAIVNDAKPYNRGNRARPGSEIAKLALDMATNNWIVTGEPIIIGKNELLDA